MQKLKFSKTTKTIIILVAWIIVVHIIITIIKRNTNLDELGPGIHFIEPAKTKHLDELNFNIDQVKWFRIWYDAGPHPNEFGDEYNYYAVSGGLAKMKKCQIYQGMNELFTQLNQVAFDSLDHKMMLSNTTGNAEYLRLRFKFKEGPFAKLGEVTITHIISEEEGVKEELGGYIIVIHSKSTRYFIKKSDYPQLVSLLNELSHTEYGRCMEYRMH